MVVRTCGYCQQGVEMDGPPHVHDPKVCRACQRELPISRFPVHKSSCDGHRLTCDECSGQRHQEVVQEQRQRRVAEREEDNRLLREHGYKWHRRRVPGTHELGWVLLNPMGEVVSKQSALSLIWSSIAPEYDDQF